jgi:hypothetical protein
MFPPWAPFFLLVAPRRVVCLQAGKAGLRRQVLVLARMNGPAERLLLLALRRDVLLLVLFLDAEDLYCGQHSDEEGDRRDDQGR